MGVVLPEILLPKNICHTVHIIPIGAQPGTCLL